MALKWKPKQSRRVRCEAVWERTISSTDNNKCKIPEASTWLRWFKGRELGEELQQWIWWKFRLCVHRGYYDTLGFHSEYDEDFEQGSDIISHVHKELLWLLFSGAIREARYEVITIIQVRNIWIVVSSRVSSKVTQLSPTLYDPMDCSLPGSSVHGIFQTRVLEWVAITSPGDLPDLGIEPGSPTLQTDTLLSEPLKASIFG